MKKLFFCLGTLAALGACKKDSDTTPASTASRTDLLTAKAWQISNVALTVNGISLPSSQFITACQLDNSFKFNTDKTLVVDEGATKCNATDPQTTSGTWAFSNTDQTKITITLPGSVFNGDADVKELSSSALRLYGAQSASGLSYTLDTTFSPK